MIYHSPKDAMLRVVMEKLIAEKPGVEYVYLLGHPVWFPFYVGTGHDDRVFDHERIALRVNPPKTKGGKPRCEQLYRMIRTLLNRREPIIYMIDSFDRGLHREYELIKYYGLTKRGGILLNGRE